MPTHEATKADRLNQFVHWTAGLSLPVGKRPGVHSTGQGGFVKVTSGRRGKTTSTSQGESRMDAKWIRTAADDASHIPMGVWLVLGVLALLLVAGCGDDTDAGSIETGSLTSEDLPGLLPDADTAGSALGVTIDQVDGRTDLPQSFEHTDVEDLTGAHVAFYRVAGESEGHNIPTGRSWIALALYETADAAEAAMEVVTGEIELGSDSVRSEFDLTDLADAGQGAVLDADVSFTWAMLRWDTLVAEIVAFHPPDTDLTEQVRGLAEEVASNLSNADG